MIPRDGRSPAEVNKNDTSDLGSFVTVTLQGKKPGQLDFTYNLSVSKTGNDILVSMDRANHTGHPVDVGDIDYFVSHDARLGGTNDKWISMGTKSSFREYYRLWAVINLIQPTTYAVNQVIRDSETGNSLLMGHVTAFKGASRFELRSGWQGKVPNRMQVRGYCSYKVTMPDGEHFDGEKLLICFSTDALRAMEHQGDLIAIAHDVRLRERRPIDIDDMALVSGNYSRFHGWMSGGSNRTARKFFEENGLFDFYWGLDSGIDGTPVPWATLGIFGLGGKRTPAYPAECFLPIKTVWYDNDSVIDFSNPLSLKLERERAFKWVSGNENKYGRAEIDFSDWWDKWPGQYDPYMSALETFRAGCLPWREATNNAPGLVVRSNGTRIDHNYGITDICRISEDADRGYEDRGSQMNINDEFTGLFTECVFGAANRFFYNGRVFWNDCDGFHIYKWASNTSLAIDRADFTAAQAKVDANFHAIAGNTLYLADALNVPYPPDRIELLKRISPPTMDVAYPVDLFVRKPARVWDMPVERPFGNWTILAVFNYSAESHRSFTAHLDAKELRLDPEKEYIVYEFWSKQLIGTFKGTFNSRRVGPCDCDVYSIVEKKNHPVLISTSRHVRQMAFDIKKLGYDENQRLLSGTSRAVSGDPYQLRIFVPEGYTLNHVQLGENLQPVTHLEGNLLTVDYTTSNGNDVDWKVFFNAAE